MQLNLLLEAHVISQEINDFYHLLDELANY